MQIVENWSDIVGEVKGHHPSQSTAGFTTLKIAVKDVKPVKGFSNLLQKAKGETLEVNVPNDIIGDFDLKPGTIVSGRVRRAGLKNIFAHPEHFKISSK